LTKREGGPEWKGRKPSDGREKIGKYLRDWHYILWWLIERLRVAKEGVHRKKTPPGCLSTYLVGRTAGTMVERFERSLSGRTGLHRGHRMWENYAGKKGGGN